MLNLKKSLIVLSITLFSVVSNAGGNMPTVVKDVPTYSQAVIQACEGSSIGAQCTITFQGGSVSIGICVAVPGPVGGSLSCQIDSASIPSCKNNAMGTPGSAMAFAVLALGVYFMRRRRLA